MKLDSLNKWLTLTANTGVLIGIALILVELNQNSQLAQAEFNLALTGQALGGEFAMMESGLADVWATSISDPQSLTVSEIRSLDSFYAGIVIGWTQLNGLEQRGLIDDGSTASAMMSARFFFGNLFAIEWWRSQREEFGPPDFRGQLDKVILAADPTANEEWIRDIQSKFE